VFVIAIFNKSSVVEDSDVTTVTESVMVAISLAICIVEEFAVFGVNPNIPNVEGASFHSAEPTGEVPSSGCVPRFTCVA